ncbi:hypothetical protein FB451DRAFT_1022268 [Mycena latifolia]|nr:hypothetical protein FB451DRAFT_1022268 [Mycena latifolia]
MPFSVKATYGRSGELRKLSFDSFPTYEQLYNQLYRVFPISHTYYLSKLLFSPDSSKSSILIGREVHNADQYNSCTAPYASGACHNAMLRFTVFDETPHKLPAGFVPDNTSPATLTGGGAPAFFASPSHIPPPPIILSTTPSSQGLMDVDTSSSDRYSPRSMSTLKPQHQHDPQSVTAGTPAACCAVSQGKVEMEQMVEKFKSDLDRILKTSFAPAPAPPSFMPPPFPPSSFCLFKYCTTCAKIFQGPWFACDKCSIVVCPGCHENQSTNNSFCVAAMAPHIMKKEVCAACPVDESPKVTPPAPWSAWSSLPLPPTAQWAAPSAQWATPPQQGYSPVYPFGAPTPVQPFIPASDLPRAPAPPAAAPLPPLPVPAVAQVPEAPTPPAPPVIHRGVVCDMCDNVVEGIRHKCLDCPDYDLCTPCIASGSAERHNPFHEFLEIKEPGRVIVHTVYSGDGERDAPSNTSRAAPTPQAEEQPVIHFATCNLCDSRIRGDRYKCADCPDFDTCSNCFSITREQHPHHAFVKLANASDYIRRDNRAPEMHFVTCNGCSKPIFGVRYKCMHPECPDFDLCESCEAFPIPMHPDIHPLLKMRSASTVVPTVYRVGQTTLIDREDIHRGRSPAPIQHSRSRSPSFDRGYMVNPSGRSNTMPTSFFDNAPTPIPPPSPFFFRSESSRSSSPTLEYLPPPLSPRFAPPPRQPSPMMMPGGLYDEPAFARQPQPSFLPMTHPYPTASRFSHSPSPSPPLFRAHSRSPSPARLSRQPTWDAPTRTEASRFWPKSSEELRHLMQHDHEAPVPAIDAFSRLSVQEEAAVMGSPLTGEALLNRPVEMAQANKAPASFNHSLAALLNGYESEPEIEKEVEEPPLRASFINDVTLHDGQIFPPGAEFMKCWQMVNSGSVEWPASTELVYVAGERLAREHGGPAAVPIGVVKAGAQVELWTGELKAPETPGRYVSYWRLRDAQGNLFGDNIWIDINVTETRSNSNESSLSSSSIIVMPRGAQSVPTASSTSASAQEVASGVSRGEVEEDEDDLSEHGSDASSVSLISVPTSEDEEWASVPAAEEPQAQRYVVLYDDASSQSSDEE